MTKQFGALILTVVMSGYAAETLPTLAAEPALPTSAADAAAQIAHGKSVFISNGCGWCHEDGGRKAGRCPQLMNSPRDDDFIISRIVGGSPGKMPAFAQQFSDTDIKALLAYIRNLKPDS